MGRLSKYFKVIKALAGNSGKCCSRPFTPATGVQIPVGTPNEIKGLGHVGLTLQFSLPASLPARTANYAIFLDHRRPSITGSDMADVGHKKNLPAPILAGQNEAIEEGVRAGVSRYRSTWGISEAGAACGSPSQGSL